MEETISIEQFIHAIQHLPSDEPLDDPGVWYRTQKEHWLGWLGHYDGPGAYGRKNWANRDAKFAYNHIVCSQMLLYLARAIPLQEDLISAAEEADQRGATLMAKSGGIRKVIPWSVIYQALFENQTSKTPIYKRFLRQIKHQ